MSRLAYAIMCHNSAEYVHDQFRLLYSEDILFLYHADAKAPARLKLYLDDLASNYRNVKIVPSILCSWAGFSLTTAMLELINSSLAHDGWDHLIFLSEQHLPLFAQRTIRDSLILDHDHVRIASYITMYHSGQLDVRNRFSWRYVEVPGVGGFATTQRKLNEDFLNGIYHGSQWVAMCRSSCELISAESDFFTPFSTSVLSDETALQTWVAANKRPVIDRSLTLVCDPSVGGSADMLFNDSIFLKAGSAGFLFIRKRPTILSDRILAYYEDILPSDGRPRGGSLHNDNFDDSRLFAGGIIDHLKRGVRGDVKLCSMPNNVFGPRLFLQIHHAELQHPKSVYLLSEDLANFKVISVFHSDFSGYESLEVMGKNTTVIRARAHALSFNRELHLDDHNGLCVVRDVNDLMNLGEVINHFVEETLAWSLGRTTLRSAGP